MKLSSLQFAFVVSLLVHGSVFSAAYVVRHSGPRMGARVATGETTQLLEIVIEPEQPAPEVSAPPPPVAAEPPPASMPVEPVAPVEPVPAPVETATLNQTPTLVSVPDPVTSIAESRPAQSSSEEPAAPAIAAAASPAVASAFAGNRADYRFCPKPVYPREARRRRQEGLVILAVSLSNQGLPQQVTVQESSGFTLLDKAALEAVRRWQFAPAAIHNETIASQVEVPVRFKLAGSDVPN